MSSTSIRQRNGKWSFDATISGRRIRRAGFATREEAQAAEEKARSGITVLRLSDASGAYGIGLRTRGKASSETALLAHLKPVFRILGDVNLADLTAAAVERFVSARLAEGASRATVNNSLRFLRCIVRRAHEDGLIPKAVRIREIKEPRRLPNILGDCELERLLAAAPAPVDLVLLLAAHAGLRHQEVVHLTVGDVLGDEIRLTAKNGWLPKSHAERSIPMTGRLRARLAVHVASLGSNPYWLFPSATEPIKPVPCWQGKVQAVFQAAGLYDRARRPGLHSLRRTCASNLLGNGVDIQTVKELLGWANLQTAEAYLASTNGRKVAAMQKLEGGVAER